MLKQVQSRNYWLRVAGSFICLLAIHTIVTYFLRDSNEPFWSLKEMQSRAGLAFFLSIIIAYRHSEQPHPEVAEDDDMVPNKWNSKAFMGTFGIMLLISLFIMSVLFGIGWVVMHVVNDKVVTPDSLYIKMLLVTSIMTFFAVIILYLSDRFGFQWKRRS